MRSATNDTAPALSVVMPVTGRLELVAETLSSLAQQTFRDWELVVPDDTPDEEQRKKAAQMVKDFSAKTGISAVWIFTQPRLYQSQNTNQGLAAARGKWLRILHSDDLLAPWALATEMSLLEGLYPAAEVLFSDVISFEDNFVARQGYRQLLVSPRHLCRTFLHSGTALPSATVFSRAAFERVGGFDPKYNFLCDWKFFLQLVIDQIRQDKCIARATGGWIGWRQHANSVTSQGWLLHFREHVRLMQELASGTELSDVAELDADERTRFFALGCMYRHRRLKADLAKRSTQTRERDLQEIEEVLALDIASATTQKALRAEAAARAKADVPVEIDWEFAVVRGVARSGNFDAAMERVAELAAVCKTPADARALSADVAHLAMASAKGAEGRQAAIAATERAAHTLAANLHFEEARRLYESVLVIDPDHSAALLGLAHCLTSLSRHAEAIPILERAAAKNGEAPAVHTMLGHCYVATAQPESAANHYRRALHSAPGDADALNNLGYALLEAGRCAEAFPLLENAVAKAPRHVNALANLARALVATNHNVEAIPYLRTAAEEAPGRNDVALALARSLVQAGFADEAVACCDRVLANDPDHKEARKLRENSAPFSGHYELWRETRFNFIVKSMGQAMFRGRSLLELGAGHGILGARFHDLGAAVTCVEARTDHVIAGAKRFPFMKFVECNLDQDFRALGKFDIVLHTGLLYHLYNVDKHLEWVWGVTGEWLILETEVADSDDPDLILSVDEQKGAYDQSFTGVGTRASAAYIERILRRIGFVVERYDDSSINAGFHRYDWKVSNSSSWKFGQWEHGLRRFWLCRKPPTLE